MVITIISWPKGATWMNMFSHLVIKNTSVYCAKWESIIWTNYAYRIMYELEWQTASTSTRGLFWCLFLELRCNEGNKDQNSTLVSAETVRHESTYIILFLTRNNESINGDKNDNLYSSSPCLTRSIFVVLMTLQSIADDVTMPRHLWRDHVSERKICNGSLLRKVLMKSLIIIIV